MIRRKVFFNPIGWHTSHASFLRYPPDGYEFVLRTNFVDKAFDIGGLRSPIFSSNLPLVKLANALIAPRVVKSTLDRLLKSPPADAALVFSVSQLARWKLPWVLYLYWPTDLTGYNVRNIYKYRSRIERALASPSCKRIVTWSEHTRKALELNFDCSSFSEKFTVIPLAVPAQEFTKQYHDDRVRLLFVGTPTKPTGRLARKVGATYYFEFYGKGGLEVLEAFDVLSASYPHVELVMRASIPPDVRHKYDKHPRIAFIEEVVPGEVMDGLFKTSDIFVFPSHQVTPTIFPEVMSYELPIVTKDLSANAEFVRDGVNGLLVRPSAKVPYYWKDMLPSVGSPLHRAYVEGIKNADRVVVEELAEKLSLLIEDSRLRRAMGQNGRRTVEQGPYAIKMRNRLLGEVFAEALS
jgi:glycosyltransferase involved in cell wall biosynthesis